MKRYKIKGMGRGFDGLIVEGEPDKDVPGLLSVLKITNSNAIFGDRNVSFPVPKGSLYIDDEFLVEYDEPPREFAHDNPYGRFMYTAEFQNQGQTLSATLTRFEKTLTVTVHEILAWAASTPVKSNLFTQNYWKELDKVESIVREYMAGDPDDLIFELKRLKEEEANGEA